MDCFILSELQQIHNIMKEILKILKEIKENK